MIYVLVLFVFAFLSVEQYRKSKRIKYLKKRREYKLTEDFFWRYFYSLEQELKDQKADRRNPWFLNLSDAITEDEKERLRINLENEKERLRIHLEKNKLIENAFSEKITSDSLFIEC